MTSSSHGPAEALVPVPSSRESSPPVATSGDGRGSSPRRWRWARRGPAPWLIGLAVVAALFVAGYLPKRHARAQLVAGTEEASRELPSVVVLKAKSGKAGKSLTLPGSLKGLEQAVLFARANGYVQRWLVDLGANVTQGQLLAELDTPELDREVEQARAALLERSASLTEARVSLEYARVNFERFRALSTAGVASQGDLQKSEAEAHVAEARVGLASASRASQLANVHRLEQLKSFARVTAPFSGIITARKVDRGTLVSAGNSALFELAVVEPLRAVIDVPQSLALNVKPGISGTLQVRELPGRSFIAKVARSSGSLEPTSRTLRVELEVPNTDRLLLPGMYAEVSLELDRGRGALSLPASAIINSKAGLRVATVDASGTVRMKPVTVERDNGSEVEIATGISTSDDIVASPRPFLVEGTRVKPTPAKP